MRMLHLDRSAQYLIVIFFLIVMGCTPKESTLFSVKEVDETGIDFVNKIDNQGEHTILDYIYYYNGGGVATADFNNDGLADLFFTGNRTDDALFMNQGNWKFEDVTQKAGINYPGWSFGVTTVDINADGWMDIYISRAGPGTDDLSYPNLLYVNQQDGTFREQAGEYGIADPHRTTQSTFFDLDRDGDLDLYVMNHGNERQRVNTPVPLKNNGSDASSDQLYENRNGQFVNISKKAGIVHEGYGLGLTIGDFNGDLWPDIYAANDFVFGDLLYLNNQDGTFTESSQGIFSHQSYNAMGTDIGDINNDGRMDLITLDMLPPDNARQKTMMGAMNYHKFEQILKNGYPKQYMRNTVHLNASSGYKEIGRLLGVHATDWSWSPVFGDFDLDGRDDLFITNGYYRDITDKDFINYSQNLAMFKSKQQADSTLIAQIDQLREVRLNNYVFANVGNLKFQYQSKKWLGETTTLSNGAVAVDLDQDGDLDLVSNELNAPARLMENTLENGHYLKFKLQQKGENPNAIGALLQLHLGGEILSKMVRSSSGYLSSPSLIQHFGLGDQTVDSLVIFWPDGERQQIAINTRDTLIAVRKNSKPYLPETEIDNQLVTSDLTHQEDLFVDFNYQSLIPRKLSHEGPAIATGDLNGDELADLFIGGTGNQPSQIIYQTYQGLTDRQALETETDVTGAVIADFNQDSFSDLLVVRVSYPEKSPLFFLGTRDGQLQKSKLPEFTVNSTSISSSDIDHDGDLDLFIGGRFVSGSYPGSPNSWLLINEDGKFKVAPDWPRKLGMITESHWVDLDQDGWDDLMIAGEWNSISVLTNNNGKIEKTVPLTPTGWWWTFEPLDIDQDGDTDFLAGNLGLNHDYNITPETPLQFLVSDFDQNGAIDPIMIKAYRDGYYPMAPRDALLRQIPRLQSRVFKYETYASTPANKLFTEEELGQTDTLHIAESRSGWYENTGNGFEFHPFPTDLQFGPIQDFEINPDTLGVHIIAAGNDRQFEILGGEQNGLDATWMKFNQESKTFSITQKLSTEDVRKMTQISVRGKDLLILGQNNSDILFLKPEQ